MDAEQIATTRVGGLSVANLGSGCPLLLLHGLIRARQDFNNVLPDLAQSFRVLAVDFRGHGTSARMPGAYGVVDYVGDGVRIVQEIAQPTVIFGHSLGAMVAAAVAAELPELVRAVILEDPPFETMGKRIAQCELHSYLQDLQRLRAAELPLPQLITALAEIRVSVPGSTVSKRLGDIRDAATLDFSARCLANADPEVLTPVVRGEWLRGYDLSSVLPRIQCPVLLMQGNRDLGGLLTDDDVCLAQKILRRCEFVRFADVGHHIHRQQPEKMLSTIYTFLASVE